MKKVFSLLSIFLCLGANDKLKKECDKGNAESCYQVAEIYNKKGKMFTKEGDKYQPLAAEYYEKSCSLGFEKGCEAMGERTLLVGYAFIQTKNPQAEEILSRGCYKFNSSESCALLGALYSDGDILKKNNTMAEFLLKKSCDMDSGFGCRLLADFYSKEKKDFFEAFEAYKKSCNFHNASGCSGVGLSYAMGRGVLQDTYQALYYLSKACDMQDGSGCNGAGTIHKLLNNGERAKEFFKKSCELKFQKGCDNYASMNF